MGEVITPSYFDVLGITVPIGRAFRADENVEPGRGAGRGAEPRALAASLRGPSGRRRRDAPALRRRVHRRRRGAAGVRRHDPGHFDRVLDAPHDGRAPGVLRRADVSRQRPRADAPRAARAAVAVREGPARRGANRGSRTRAGRHDLQARCPPNIRSRTRRSRRASSPVVERPVPPDGRRLRAGRERGAAGRGGPGPPGRLRQCREPAAGARRVAGARAGGARRDRGEPWTPRVAAAERGAGAGCGGRCAGRAAGLVVGPGTRRIRLRICCRCPSASNSRSTAPCSRSPRSPRSSPPSLFGLAPALALSRPDLVPALKGSGRETARPAAHTPRQPRRWPARRLAGAARRGSAPRAGPPGRTPDRPGLRPGAGRRRCRSTCR